MASYVLDTTALTTLLRREPGFEKVLPHVYGGLISSVNMSEVLTLCLASNGNMEDCKRELAKLHLIEVPFDQNQAMIVALLKMSADKVLLTFPDLAALSLGVMRNATLITKKDQLTALKKGPRTKLIRSKAKE